MKKSTHPFVQLMLMAVVSLAMAIAVSLAMAAAGALGADPGEDASSWWMQNLMQLAMFLVPPLLVAAVYHRGESRAYLGLDFSGRQWLNGLAGVVLLLLLMPLIDWTTAWNDGWHWSGRWAPVEERLRSLGEGSEQMMEALLSTSSVRRLAANLFTVALVPAICEEMFFRAGVQNLLCRWWRNPHAAVWVAAAVFSLVHGEFFAFVPRLLMGALLGYLYLRSGSLLVNVATHFANNAVVVVYYFAVGSGWLSGDPSAPLATPWLPTACCTLAALGIYGATFCKKLKTSQ